MNSATLDKTEIKKRLKKRHHADSRVRFYFSDQYVLKSKIHILSSNLSIDFLGEI